MGLTGREDTMGNVARRARNELLLTLNKISPFWDQTVQKYERHEIIKELKSNINAQRQPECIGIGASYNPNIIYVDYF